ncbi:Stk1 family PASTA domain-containing Ser/Thr kinase [Kocuria massiliensis]|uniref:Stk1 family PASTA domain-containing Ser/Thr kinase n=1 Tax=Kocuria massiliensis TaxID=1926282 RepID=UPI0022B9486A|nr:Stk1 family PASTA domain-containing Ser/Thr kinase [Kocuria massiliensis]
MTVRVPRILDNRYELGEILGSGGMATVYAAEDTRLGRPVAIKVLRPEHAKNAVFRIRFRREAEAIASLNHPTIVAVFDTGTFRPMSADEAQADPEATAPMPKVELDRVEGEDTALKNQDDADAVPYIVMESLSGHTLKEVMATTGQFPVEHAVSYAEGVLDALQYSHEHDIIHRDVKPANVMVLERTEEDRALNRPSRIKVMDFGIARAMTESAKPLTEAQTIMGTARYISPEQARGETVDERSDLYAVGCLLYQMLAGRPPFDGESSVDIVGKHLRQTPAPPSEYRQEISPALDALVLKALEKNRADRFQSAEDFAFALDNASHGISVNHAGSTEDDATQAIGGVTGIAAGATAAGAGAAASRAADHHGIAQDDEATETSLVSDQSAGPDDDSEYTMSDGARTEMEDASVSGFFPSAQDEYTDDELYEYERNKALAAKKRRRTAWKNVILGLVIFLLAATALGAWLYYQNELNKPVYVNVPTVASQTEQQAEDSLRNEGLKVNVKEDYSDKVESGHAIGTDPEDGTQVEKDSTVTLKVSKGPSSVTIPDDLAGQSEAYVRSRLEEMGLKAGRVQTANSPSVQAGLVIGTEPKLGDPASAGSTVNLILSTGKVQVPNVVGMNRDTAISTLTSQDTLLSTEIITEDSTEPAGTVIRQSAQAGTSIAQGSTVTITVSSGPKATPSPTPSSSPSGGSNNNPGAGNDSKPSSSPSPSSPAPSSSAEPTPSKSQ